ncbi:amidase [Pseudoroseicyclus tamaricis]|uniref:Amidase n=1 Tax=Pseudoroseicyclus tamaricis TaxID=2705421 RepID=A0A6B2JTD4_9RHOB|nr:amidase family protein [Pseudoroseicyclus tamaricis]NDV01528.1 amidase [Pseudoroseicyclus tamaricis]
MDEWRQMSAAALGRGIGAGEIDPVALAETFLSAAGESHDIYARLTPDRALAEARAAADRAKTGTRRGPLDGVPVSWKDLFDSAGVATEAGTALMAGRVPERDAAVLARGSAEGLVCLGKTHMSEIAFSGLGLNPITATPPNIHDPEVVPGGSSSGAATSVAFGLAAGGIGSDTGGSCRIPAAWNDITGFKPAHGALPLTGSVPLAASFDTIGPLARTVEDCALLYAALGGRGVDLSGASLAGRRLLLVETVVGEGLEEAPAAGLARAVEALEAAGAVVERRALPCLTGAYELSGPLYTGEAWGAWSSLIEPAPEKMFPQILKRVSAGRDVPAPRFVAGWERLRALREEFRAATAGYDAVICASAPLLPPNKARLLEDEDYYVEANLLTLRNTRMANLMGLASISLPTGVPSAGLLLNALPEREGLMLRLAAAAEAALAG